MTTAARLADQIRRSVFGDAWHGPSLLENLESVTGGGRIEQTVRHATVWMKLTDEAIAGKPMPPWPFPSDFPMKDWPEATGELAIAVQDLQAVTESLVRSTTAFPDTRLDETVPGRDHTFYHQLSGIAQHNAYHGGQIALLKKKSSN